MSGSNTDNPGAEKTFNSHQSDEAETPEVLTVNKFKGQLEVINTGKLKAFEGHPFEPYFGKRFEALVESIRRNGIHNPIIVRPVDNDMYEILSGHNRVRASCEAEQKDIPSMVLRSLTDDEAWLIVTETNLYQRSTTDMRPSELALALTAHYEATKKQGKRTDVVQVIEEIETAASDPETSGTVYQKSDARKNAGAIYGMSSRNVGHYLRINKLIGSLKGMLNVDRIAKRTAVALSYLSERDQKTVGEYLSKSDHSLSESEAETLREEAKGNPLTQKRIKEILNKPKRERAMAVKLDSSRLADFFDLGKQDAQDVEKEILEALKFYREHNAK